MELGVKDCYQKQTLMYEGAPSPPPRAPPPTKENRDHTQTPLERGRGLTTNHVKLASTYVAQAPEKGDKLLRE